MAKENINKGKWVWRVPGRDVWQYRFDVKGQTYSGSTGLTNKRAAEAFAKAQREQIAADLIIAGAAGSAAAGQVMTIKAAVRFYIDEQSSLQASESAKKADEELLLMIAARIGPATLVKDIDDVVVRKFRDSRRKDHRYDNAEHGVVMNSTVNHTLDMLRRALFYVRDAHKAPMQNIVWKKLRLPDDAVVRVAIDVDHRAAIYAALRPGYRDLFRFAQMIGWRRKSLTNLLWTEVDFRARELRIIQKGDEFTVTHITDSMLELLTAMKAWQEAMGAKLAHVFAYEATRTWRNPKTGATTAKGQLYPITYEGWGSAYDGVKKRLGLTCTTHDIRRTVGIQVTRAAGIHAAAATLNHKNIALTFKHYAMYDNGDRRNALEVLEQIRRAEASPV